MQETVKNIFNKSVPNELEQELIEIVLLCNSKEMLQVIDNELENILDM